MASIEESLKNADKLAQDTVNAWGLQMQAGNAEFLLPEFKALFDLACAYQNAKQRADVYRLVDDLKGTDGGAAVAEETGARGAFVEAYHLFYENHPGRVSDATHR